MPGQAELVCMSLHLPILPPVHPPSRTIHQKLQCWIHHPTPAAHPSSSAAAVTAVACIPLSDLVSAKWTPPAAEARGGDAAG